MLTPPPNLPPIPRFKALTKWLNEMRDYVASLNPMPSHNVQVFHTDRGTSYVGVPQAATSAPAQNWFKGEYSFTTPYIVGQGVKISGGIAAGTYICIVNVTMHPGPFSGPPEADASTYPWLGNNWSFIGQVLDQSNWI